jgi:hypothetical protein
MVYYQFEKISIQPIIYDIDFDDHLKVDVNMDHDIGEHQAIIDVLSEANLRNGYEWNFNFVTGEFSFLLNDQNIWKVGDIMKDEMIIELAFEVSDSAGESDIVSVELTLKDVNEPPPYPEMFEYTIFDEDPTSPGIQGLLVRFSAREIIDPDQDDLTYIWDFGDGQTATGIQVNHTFASEGTKTIILKISDGEFTTEPRVSVINLVEVTTSPQSSSDGGLNILWILIPIIVLVLIGVVVAISLIVVKRKPKEEPNDDEVTSEQNTETIS